MKKESIYPRNEKPYKGNIDEIIDLVKDIIENKKKLDADFSHDERYLKEFLRIKEELHENMEQND